MNKKEEGLRYNDNKPRPDLITGQVQLGIGKVLEFGARKYAEHNWEKGMKWSKIFASLERHIAKVKAGEDIDDESKLPHVDHIACNAVFLAQYFRSHPELDDRFFSFIMNHKRVALDIDGVLADFITPANKRAGVEGRGNASWYTSYKMRDADFWKKLAKDKKFWLNLEPLIDPDDLAFEPVAYVTARSIPTEWTMEWLERNGFPCNPVVTVGTSDGKHASKAQVLKDLDVDIFIEDNYDQFLELNKEGVRTYLLNTFYNKRWNVGNLRINHINDVLTYHNL